MRILIVEDELALAHAVVDIFHRDGTVADVAHNVFEAIEKAMTLTYDCIVMDVMLPDGSGVDAVKQLRKIEVPTPILMLTVQNEPADRVVGLNAGADDYLGKPFNTEELVARVNALVRRGSALQEESALTHGGAELHRRSRTLTLGSDILSLSSKEYLLMEYFFRNAGQVLTREQLILHAWGPDAEVADNALDTYVYYLRKKAARIGWKSSILTIRGQGYMLGNKV